MILLNEDNPKRDANGDNTGILIAKRKLNSHHLKQNTLALIANKTQLDHLLLMTKEVSAMV